MGNEAENKPKFSYRRRSFFGPILLITIGLVFLGKNLGLIPGEGWGTIWRLWPLVLIIGGLDDLFRREGVAWPVLMIAVGAVLLMHYFGPRTMISWTQILQLWPILIIAVGIDIFFKGETGWKSLLGVFLSIVLIGAAVFMAVQGVQIQAEYLHVNEVYSSDINSAELELDLDVGYLILGEETKDGRLISGSITPGTIEDDLDQVQDQLVYGLASTKPAFYPHTARWELQVSPDLPLELEINTSVGEMFLELDSLDLESLLVEQGVGRIYLALPDQAAGELTIKQGVGLIEIEIPENTRIAVDAQNGLTRVKFPPHFELENGYYTTSGTTSQNADLLIVVEQGVGMVSFIYSR